MKNGQQAITPATFLWKASALPTLLVVSHVKNKERNITTKTQKALSFTKKTGR